MKGVPHSPETSHHYNNGYSSAHNFYSSSISSNNSSGCSPTNNQYKEIKEVNEKIKCRTQTGLTTLVKLTVPVCLIFSQFISLIQVFLNGLVVSQSLTPALDIHAVVITEEYFKPRILCDENEVDSSKKVNTTERLKMLRQELIKEKLSAYIILANDEHQSETVSEHDKRLKFITGFSGSNGIAVVTLESAALWTDSRYFLQAEEEMDCNWSLMKMGVQGTPTIEQWLSSELKGGQAVSSDPKICAFEKWVDWKNNLEKSNIVMKVVRDNLIDRIWKVENGRPPSLNEPIFILDVKFAGLSWQNKLELIRSDMKKAKVDAFVFTALDEIAWILNLRGADIKYFPVFRSYLIIKMTGAVLYVSEEKVTSEIIKHLNADSAKPGDSVEIRKYRDIWDDLPRIAERSKKVGLPSKFSYFNGVSYLMHHSVPAEKTTLTPSPALIRKDYKNPVEVAGMKASHIRDGLVVCQLLCLLEEEVSSKRGNWTELKVVEVINGLRRKQKYNAGISFGTISAFGKNAANAHYQPTPETNAVIDTSQLFMLDSGGQYYDGTTDTTRTVHFGTPRDIEKEIYTRLLIGCINVATTTFKEGYGLKELEILIRSPLYELGLDYGHGSTHGIGSFLAVHEAFNVTYHADFFGSQEPGYYKDNEFGMRLENIVTVVKSPVSENKKNNFYTFETVTMIPYEKKLLKLELLEKKHINWLNKYHEKVRQLVGAEMLRQGLKKEYQWLLKKTEPIILSK